MPVKLLLHLQRVSPHIEIPRGLCLADLFFCVGWGEKCGAGCRCEVMSRGFVVYDFDMSKKKCNIAVG